MASRDLVSSALLTPWLLVQTARLHGELADAIERARDVRWWARQLRTRSAATWRRTIQGGAAVDDAAQVLAIITRASLCEPCIGRQSGIDPSRVAAILTGIAETIALVVGNRPCTACRETKTTYGFNGGASDTRETGRGANGTRRTILNFLGQHHGAAFCAECITLKLFPGKNIDGPMRHLEGIGVRRYHDHCSACGKPRLVASLPSSN